MTDEYRANCLASGMDLFTVKPVSERTAAGARSAIPILCLTLSAAAVALCCQVNVDELMRVLKIASNEHKKMHDSPMTLAGPSASPPPAAPLFASSAPPRPPAASTAPADAPASHVPPDAASATDTQTHES